MAEKKPIKYDANDRQQELEDISKIASTPEGVRFFARLITEGKILKTTFVAHDTSSAYNEGRRSLALQFFNDIFQSTKATKWTEILEAATVNETEVVSQEDGNV